MFDLNSRARHATLGALLCVAAATLAACAHTQQAPPSDSASPRGQGQWQHDGDGSRMRHGGGHNGDMLKDLNLTKEQHEQVKAIHDRYRKQAESLRKNGADRDSTSREQFRSMRKQEMNEIRAILTPDQQKQFDDKMAKMKERHERHDDHDGHDGPGDHDAPPPPAPPAS